MRLGRARDGGVRLVGRECVACCSGSELGARVIRVCDLNAFERFQRAAVADVRVADNVRKRRHLYFAHK